MRKTLLIAAAAVALMVGAPAAYADDCVTVEEFVTWLHEPPTEIPEDFKVLKTVKGESAQRIAAALGFQMPARVGEVYVTGAAKWPDSRGVAVADKDGCMLQANGGKASSLTVAGSQAAYGVFPTVMIETLVRKIDAGNI